ncbi:MAG: repeat protein [Gemmataceae bacterium]|nr:repeat protein [Gemmataceae bacterium]
MGSRNQARVRRAAPARLRVEVLEAREVPAGIGTLDPTFGSGGWVSIPSNVNTPGGQAVAVDGLGRTVFASSARTLQVTRVNPNGSLDLSFGSGGTVDLGASNFAGAAVTVDASGDIVILCGGNVTRLTPAGTPDTIFGTSGTVSLGSTGFGVTQGGGVAVDAAGNIIVAGDAMRVVRLTHSGGLDPTFNRGAAAWVGGPNELARSNAVTIDSSGRIVVAGLAGGVNVEWSVGRLNPDGTLDTTFAATGNKTFLITPNTVGVASSVAIDRSGNIFVAGNDGGHAAVVKLTAAGEPDPTFGSGGVFEAPISTSLGEFTPVSLALRPDGDIVAAATVALPPGRPDSRERIFLFEVTPSGTLDPSFNPTGPIPGTNVLDHGPGMWNQEIGLALTPAGDILVGGIGETTAYGLDIDLVRLVGTAPADPVDPFGSVGVSVRTAVGDVNGDGIPDTIYATGPGTPLRVAVVSGADNKTLLVAPVDPFGDNFTGGGYVAAADFDHSGRAQAVVAADAGGGPRIAVWGLLPDGQWTARASFFGITGDPAFRGGTRVAVGDVNADGTPDLVVAAGSGGGPRVAVFDGTTLRSGTPTKLVNDFFAFPGSGAGTLRNGAYVAVGDVTGDGYGDLIFGAGPGGGPRVLVVSGKVLAQSGPAAALAAPVSNFFVGGTDTTRTGAAVAVTTAARDGVADVAAGPAAGTKPVPTPGQPGVKVAVYAGSALTAGTPPTPALTIDPATDPVLAGVFVG